MAASAPSLPNDLTPPSDLVSRKARVGTKGRNTLRMPNDSSKDDTASWFTAPPGNVAVQGNPMNPISTGNEVKYFVDAPATFDEMTDAMDTATGQDNGKFSGKDHFIYLLNWWADDSFELRNDVPSAGSPGQCNSCLLLKLRQASARGVTVRAMFWDQQMSSQNDKEVNDINGLPTGAAVLDGRGNEAVPTGVPLIPIRFGSQHQKILCVFGEAGLIAFCGGVDFNTDRVVAGGSGSPLHDVHCRVRGPAAADLLQIFVQRWNDHPQGQQHNRPPAMGGKGPLVTLNALPDPAGPQTVQIGRTFGDIGGSGIKPYGFAAKGERTAREVILAGIRNAKRFLYTEDQYFIGNPQLQAALMTTLAKPTFQHFTVVLTHFKISDLPLVHEKRRNFLQPLMNAAPGKVRVFFLRGTGSQSTFDAGQEPHTYVHAKIWIADDEFASIGSVNSNNRSWSHDSEVTAGIYDVGNDAVLTYHMAHKLRIELWQEHLNMGGATGAAELSDGVAAAAQWLAPPAGARIKPYDIHEPGDHHFLGGIPILGLPIEEALFGTFMDPA
jgi:phosphatidylserine/phosphatidylglycerophosphate/cardiolipin synthase-like enzyme